MEYTAKPIVCDYAVIRIGGDGIVCICNIRKKSRINSGHS